MSDNSVLKLYEEPEHTSTLDVPLMDPTELEKIGLRPTDVIYYAGILDGEGCVMLSKCKYKNGKTYYKPRVSITGCYYPTLKYLKNLTGCLLYRQNPKDERPCYTAIFNGAKALLFLKALLPFLKEKRNQALALLEVEKYPPKSSQHERIHKKLRALKKVFYEPT